MAQVVLYYQLIIISMKTLVLVLITFPIIGFSQAKTNLYDSLSIKYFKDMDTVKPVPIPNKKISTYPKYSVLITKSKGNAIEIPNMFKPKDSLIAKKDSIEDLLNHKK